MTSGFDAWPGCLKSIPMTWMFQTQKEITQHSLPLRDTMADGPNSFYDWFRHPIKLQRWNLGSKSLFRKRETRLADPNMILVAHVSAHPPLCAYTGCVSKNLMLYKNAPRTKPTFWKWSSLLYFSYSCLLTITKLKIKTFQNELFKSFKPVFKMFFYC